MDLTELPELPENIDTLEVDALLDLHTPLAAKRDELLAAPASLARNRALAEVTARMNTVAGAINELRTVEQAAAVALADVPAPVTETETPTVEEAPAVDAKELVVTAAAAAAASTAPPVTNTRDRSRAAWVGTDGATLDTARIGERIAASMSSSGWQLVAAVDRFSKDAARLGQTAAENHRILFGDTDRLDTRMTAAICGPAEPIREVPICITAAEPIADTLNQRPVTYGQIQVYAPISLQVDVMHPAPDCEGDCGSQAPAVTCGTISDCDPLPPVKAEPMQACVCLSESYLWSAPHMTEAIIAQLYAQFAGAKDSWRLAGIRAQSYNRTFTPPYGFSRGLKQAALQALAAVNVGRYDSNDGYYIAIPRGASYATMADTANTVFGTSNAADDILAEIERLLGRNSMVVEYLDWDSTGPAAGPVQISGPLGAGGSVALEDFHQNPAIYIYPKGKFLSGAFGRTELGLNDVDRELMEKGCRKLTIREWNTPPIAFGCAPSLVIDFTEVCVSGTYPDATAPFC